MPKADGSTNRQHFEMIERIVGKRPPEYVTVELPPHVDYLVEMFFDLNSSRPVNSGNSLNTIPYTEIDAYCNVTSTSLEPWEVDVLRELDKSYVNAVIKNRNEDTTQ